MATSKKEYSGVDAQPVVLYGLTTPTNQNAVPIIANASGSLVISESVPTTIADNRRTVTTAGTRVQLSTASTTCISVAMTAFLGNTGVICVGGSTVVASAATRTGVPLSAGDSLIIEIDDLSKIYLDSTVNGEGVSYYYKT